MFGDLGTDNLLVVYRGYHHCGISPGAPIHRDHSPAGRTEEHGTESKSHERKQEIRGNRADNQEKGRVGAVYHGYGKKR